MKKKIVYCICFCLFFSGSIVSATDDPVNDDLDIVRAKIGIQIHLEDESRRAKVSERVMAGTRLRIYVQPESVDAYIHVIHTDQEKVIQLNKQEHITSAKPILKLPLPPAFYQFDGASPLESITVICSPVELPEIARLLEDQETSYDVWVEFEKELIAKSTIDLSDTPSKPWTLAAGIRGGETDDFVKELQIFSGKSLLFNVSITCSAQSLYSLPITMSSKLIIFF